MSAHATTLAVSPAPPRRLTASDLKESQAQIGALRIEVNRVLVGQRTLLDRMLIGLVTGGHVLLEGVPGLAKTTAVKALAAATHATFHRIQFTPDLLPSDITGNLIYNPGQGDYRTKLGPIFAHFVLADEINRAPAKVQSALLEAMQEGQVTIGEQSHPLPQPFLVLATENPLEHEGTYPLPEAQVDRFMLKVEIGYPTPAEEMIILERMSRTKPVAPVSAVVSTADILQFRDLVDAVHVAAEIKDYIVQLVLATRGGERSPATVRSLIRYGASPRATINLALAAKAHAWLQGETYVSPDDVKAIAPDVLRHRIIPTFEAEAEGITAGALATLVIAGVKAP
jgi:MoxR-like ATPase